MMEFRSFAKLNLYLDVLNRRRDGYHNIETIFQTISLYDSLLFEANEALVLDCNFEALAGEDNIVLRAARLLRERSHTRAGARIRLEKRIPVAAGMAGGSGNAAATLTALNQLWKLDWPRERLWRLAQELGADVPYCLYGGTMAATERGDHLTPLLPLPETWFVLVHPPLALSSATVYNHPLLEYKTEKAVGGRTPSFETIVKTLQQGNVPGVVFNRMEKPVFAEHPELLTLKEALINLGCTAASMSGSGPTLFGICTSERQARDIAVQIDCRTSVAKSAGAGIEEVERPVSSAEEPQTLDV